MDSVTDLKTAHERNNELKMNKWKQVSNDRMNIRQHSIQFLHTGCLTLKRFKVNVSEVLEDQ